MSGKIWTTKRETARRLKQRIRVALDWAKASRHRDGDNPVDGITPVLPRAVCEAALAHVVRDKAEAAYFRSALFELRRKLMNQWAAFATAAPEDVVSIRR